MKRLKGERKIFFQRMENQRQFMDKLYIKLKLKSFNGWEHISRRKIIDNGGKYLILSHYNNNYSQLLSSIYPNYPFSFENIKITIKEKEYFKNLKNQQKFMDILFKKFELKQLDDFLQIGRQKIIKNGGKKLIKEIYFNDFSKLLTNIYPNFPFQLNNLLKINSNAYFKSIKNQRKFMENLAQKLHIKIEQLPNISNNLLIVNGGKSLLINYYKGNYDQLLSTIFPEISFQNFDLKLIKNQKEFMNFLYKEMELNSLADWLKVSKKKFIKYGGKELLKLYKDNLLLLLQTIYPIDLFLYYDNNININNINNNINNINNNNNLNDTKKKNILFAKDKNLINKNNIKENFNNYDNKNINKNNIEKSNQINERLKIILQNNNKKKRKKNYNIKFLYFQFHKLLLLKEKYKINEEKDWYRLPIKTEEIDVFHSLKIIFPDINWKRNFFLIRSKKTNQRLLFVYLQKIYSPFCLYENYKHPFLNLHFSDLNNDDDNNNIINNNNNNINNNNIKKNNDNINNDNSINNNIVNNNLNSFENIYNIVDINNNNNNNNINNNLNIKNSPKDLNNNNIINEIKEMNRKNMEFDIFIPSHNLAFEYQGEQHFDDIPSAFSNIELYRDRDFLKVFLTSKLSIKLIVIPFWWDHSFSSLLSSLRSKLEK